MAAKKNSNKNDQQTIDELNKKIAELEAENKKLTAQKSNTAKPKKHILRSFGTTFFITLSIVTFMLFNIANWAKATVLDTDGFIEATSPLIDQPAVQKTLQDEITNALFENIDVEDRLNEALPENLKFLAGPLAGQVESYTYSKVGEILASDKVEDIWDTTLANVHQRVVGYIQNEENDGVISVSEVYTFAGEKLGDSPVSFLLNKQLPDKVGNITIKQITWLDEARTYVNYLEKLPIVLFITSILSFILAVLIAVNKKTAIISLVLLNALLMVSTIIALVIGKEVITGQVQAQYADAASEVYTVITSPLMARTQGYLALFGVLLLVFFVTSSLGLVKTSRNFIAHNVTKLVNNLTPAFEYPQWMNWVVENRSVIAWTAFGVIFVAVGLRLPPDYAQVIDGFITSSIITMIYLLATQVLIAGKQKQE